MNDSLLLAVAGGAVALSLGIAGVQTRKNTAMKKRLVDEKAAIEKSFEVIEDAIFIVSPDMRMEFLNRSARKMISTGQCRVGEPLPVTIEVRIKNEWLPLERCFEMIEQHKKEKIHTFPDIRVALDGARRDAKHVNMYIEPTVDLDKRPLYIVVFKDISDFDAETTLTSTHQLTGLPNKIQAKKDLNSHFAKLHRDQSKKLAVMVAELDHFVKIRATIGDEQSDKMLIAIAEKLQQLAHKHGYEVYHTFSNHFFFILPDIQSQTAVSEFCDEMQKMLKGYYSLDSAHLHLSASTGIAMYPESGSTYTLVDNAYKALDEAKEKGYGQCVYHKRTQISEKYDEIKLYNAIHDAIANGEFEIYYQPIVRTGDHEVVAAEALIRWKHPEYGYVPPPIFIPMLEKSGYIIELGQYVLNEVLKQQKKWELFKFRPIEVSINMSMLELESGEFVPYVAKKLKEHQVAPELIKFEITEGLAMQNEASISNQLIELRQLGVGLALDDFGTGYTSFSYLKKIPASVLKIDKSLIENIVRNQEDQQIIHAMIELAHNLDMKIVAEGIETKQMVDILTEFRCDYLQGFYFSRPLPVFEFQEKIRFDTGVDTTIAYEQTLDTPSARSINRVMKNIKKEEEEDYFDLKE